MAALAVAAVIAAAAFLPRPAEADEPTSNATTTKPNVLLVITDDQPSRLFNRALMPHTFAGVVDRGVRFDRAYVNTPLCCPSRAQMLTGLRGHHTGVDVNSTPLKRPTLVQKLQASGYRTVLGGKYLNSEPCTKPPGFHRWACVGPGIDGYTMVDPRTNIDGTWYDLKGYSTDLQADFIGDFVDATPSTTPFFAVYAPTSPHLPANDPRCATLPVTFTKSAAYDEETRNSSNPAYLRRPPLMPAEHAQIEDEYKRMARAVQCLDGSIGRLLNRIESRAATTAVIFVSDHGYLYGEHRRYQKTAPAEEAVRVPMVVRYPAWTPESSAFRTSALAENVDITATIAELAGVSWPGDGVSLGPILRRTDLAVRDAVLIEHCQGASWPCPWTNFRFANDSQLAVPGSWGIVTSRYKYLEYRTGERQLFDLLLDPDERANRLEDPVLSVVRDELAAQLQAMRSPPPPETSIVTGPAGSVLTRVVQFTYTTQSRAASYRCRLDKDGVSGQWHPCNGGSHVYGPLEDGNYLFTVTGTNEAGRSDASPAARSFAVTSTRPAVRIDAAPPGDSANRDVSIRFSSSVADATFECRLSLATNLTAPWQSCVSPYSRSNVADGYWRFEVRAVAAGARSNPGALALFRIDGVGPSMVLDAAPRSPATSSNTARFVFHPDQPTVGPVTCRIDAGTAFECGSGTVYRANLADGLHTLSITASDAAGRSRSTTATWKVDTVAPVLQFANGPPTPTTAGDASFSITASEKLDGLYCRLDGAHAFSLCPQPVAFTGLAPGQHRLEITSKDYARNLSAPVAWTWTQEGGEVP